MSVAPLLVGYTQALSSIQPMSSQNVQNPSTSNHKELWGCCIGTQTALAVERFVCQRRDCNGGSGSECIAISFCDAVAPYRLRFSAKIAIDFNSSPAFHGRATLLGRDRPPNSRDLPIRWHSFRPSRNYGHEQAWHDGNGHSRLQATPLGSSLTVPISDGKLVLGTW